MPRGRRRCVDEAGMRQGIGGNLENSNFPGQKKKEKKKQSIKQVN